MIIAYEASGKSLYIVYYAVALYLYLHVNFQLHVDYQKRINYHKKIKHLFSNIIFRITFFLTCVRILIWSTLRPLRVKFFHFVLFRNATKRYDISYLCNAFALYLHETDQWYRMPIIPSKEILLVFFLCHFHYYCVKKIMNKTKEICILKLNWMFCVIVILQLSLNRRLVNFDEFLQNKISV